MYGRNQAAIYEDLSLYITIAANIPMEYSGYAFCWLMGISAGSDALRISIVKRKVE